MERGFCSCVIGEAKTINPYRATTPVSRKEYECCECHDAIPKGTRYQRITGILDGHGVDYTTCLVCAHIRKDFCAPIGELDERLRELIGVGLNGEIVEDRHLASRIPPARWEGAELMQGLPNT